MGTPLELVKYNMATGKFEVGAKAMDVLRKVKGPIAVVAVCGRARQGKSFILNVLLQKSGGFQVGATHRPCTKGLWMWSTPQQVKASDGSSHHLLLLDTEGIDAYDQTNQYSTQIFSLAVLLSSLFIYNHMGGIDESALDRLSMVAEMTKRVRVRAASANSTTDAEESLGEHSPTFLWLLRDFYLQLEEEGGRKITPREYLETVLRPVAGTGPAAEAKNATRTSITKLFPTRDCFSLVRPMTEEAALVNMDCLPRDKLRPEFQEGVRKLENIILQRATPKRFGSQFMTGSVLAGLVNAYAGAINHGAIPTIATAWQGVAESECRRGCDAAEAAYVAAWAPGGEVLAEEAELEARHQKCLAAARAAYSDIAVGDETIRKAHEIRWTTAVESRYKDLRHCRLAEAAAAVTELLYKGVSMVTQMLQEGDELPSLQQRIAAFVADFEKRATGSTKWQKLAAFLGETWPKVATQVVGRQAAAAKAALEAVQRDNADLRKQLAAEHKRAEQAERLYHDASSSGKALQEQLGAFQQEAIRQRSTLDQRSSAVAALQKQVADLQREAETMRASLEQKAGAASSFEQQLSNSQREIAQLRAALEDKSGAASSFQQQLSNSQREIAQLRAALEDKSGAASSFQQQLAASQQEGARMRAALDQKAAKVAALEGQMSEILVSSERKQASAAELADARVRAFESELQAKFAEMTAVITAERARAESLVADRETLVARCSSTEARLAAQEAEASEWRHKYMREASVKLELQGQRDEARDGLQLLTVERDSVARERDAARAEAEQLRADVQAETRAKDSLQTQMEGYLAEAQAARTQPVRGATTMYNDGNNENLGPATEGGPNGRDRVLVDGGNVSKMTILEIKDALTQAGFEQEVWRMANKKPAPKKSEWVEMFENCQQAVP